jgi:hypothetical protein
MIPRTIWFYWDENPSSLIQNIKTHNEAILVNWKIIYLTSVTLSDYISDYPSKFNTLIPQHKSDWIRSYLLSTYGGCWCDASIIFNSVKELDQLWMKSNHMKSTFTGFYKTSIETQYNIIDDIPTKIENWFFMVPLNSIIMKRWFKEFTKAIDVGFLKYRNDLLGKINLDIYYPHGITNNVYLIHNMILQYVVRDEPQVLLLMDADKTMFKLRSACFKKNKTSKHKRSICVMNKLKKKSSNKIPFIKLSSCERNTRININGVL